MTIRSEDEAFVSVLRREMIRIEQLLAEVPSLLRKRHAIYVALVEYGNPMEPLAATKRTTIATSIEEIATPRPAGIPADFYMISAVIRELGPLGSTEIRDAIEKRWWPGIPRPWGKAAYRYLQDGRLMKNANNKFSLPPEIETEKPAPPAAPEPDPPDNVLPKEPSRAPMPKVKPTAGPRPPAPGIRSIAIAPTKTVNAATTAKAAAEGGTVGYKHGNRTIMLFPKQHAVVSRLRVNEGVVLFKDVTDAAFPFGERSPPDAAAWLRDTVPDINSKLKILQLELVLVPKMGYALKETN